jgi:hypothetical protein
VSRAGARAGAGCSCWVGAIQLPPAALVKRSCLPTPLPNHGAITMFIQPLPGRGPCTSCVGLLVQAPSLTTHYHAPFTLAQSASCLPWRAWSILKGWNITVDDGYAGCYAPKPHPTTSYLREHTWEGGCWVRALAGTIQEVRYNDTAASPGGGASVMSESTLAEGEVAFLNGPGQVSQFCVPPVFRPPPLPPHHHTPSPIILSCSLPRTHEL